MRHTARELRRLLGQQATRNRQFNDVLLSDPAAAIAVFRALGRARPGASGLVTDAGHALSLIGLDPFRRLLDALPEVAAGRTRQAGVGSPATAYSQAAHAAFYAGTLSQHKGLGRNSEIGTAALLQNPAIHALWATDPESAQRATNAVRDEVPVDVAFGAELGEPLHDANHRLAAAWALPSLARQAMAGRDAINPRPRMVKLADGLAQTSAAGWRHAATETFTEQLSEFLDLSRDQACAWLHQQAIAAARALSHCDYPLPGFELMFMPGEIAEDEHDGDLPVMGQRRPHAAPPQPGAVPDLHAMMADIMRRIRDESGAARVIFAMLNSDRSRLRTRLALGGQPDDGLRRLDFDLGQKNLFVALLGRSQSVWLNDGNADRYRAHLPASLQQMLAPQDAYMMSLFVRGQPLGLLYGDGGTLSEQGYRRFRQLCNEATAALGGNHRVADSSAA
jgi:hypothetical protein